MHNVEHKLKAFLSLSVAQGTHKHHLNVPLCRIPMSKCPNLNSPLQPVTNKAHRKITKAWVLTFASNLVRFDCSLPPSRTFWPFLPPLICPCPACPRWPAFAGYHDGLYRSSSSRVQPRVLKWMDWLESQMAMKIQLKCSRRQIIECLNLELRSLSELFNFMATQWLWAKNENTFLLNQLLDYFSSSSSCSSCSCFDADFVRT